MIKIKAYPNVEMEVASLVYDYMLKCGFTDIIKEYELDPFKLKVQAAERTFVDKIFALADYYLSDKITEHSRHIYDLHMMRNKVKLDQDLKKLYDQVKLERKPHQQICLSAQDDVDMKAILGEIIEKAVYQKDYNEITALLIFDDVKYAEAIKTLVEVRDFI